MRPLATIFILDCCRTYHLRNEKLDTRQCRSPNMNEPNGLKAMHAENESLIVFACAAGATSDEGKTDRNGLFTKHLLKYIETPNENVLLMLSDVMYGVKQESKSEQIPYIYSSLTNKRIYLNDNISSKFIK